MENPNNSTKTSLELVNKFNKVADTKSIYRNPSSFNTPMMNNEKEKLTFTIAWNRIKYLGIHLTKNMKDLYTDTLMKNIEEDTQKNRKLSYDHGLEELLLLTCPYYPMKSIDAVQSL